MTFDAAQEIQNGKKITGALLKNFRKHPEVATNQKEMGESSVTIQRAI